MEPILYASLDAAAFALTMGLVAFFLLAWLRSEGPLYLLLLVGFFLVAVGFLGASPDEFSPAAAVTPVDAVRVAGQTGGALVLALAYASFTFPRLHTELRAAAWGVATGTAVVCASVWAPTEIVEPAWRALAAAGPYAHAVQLLAFASCAAIASRGYLRVRTAGRALAPLGFLSWSLGKYTLLLFDASGSAALIPLVYAWIFVALYLTLLAVVTTPRVERAPRPAPSTGGAY